MCHLKVSTPIDGELLVLVETEADLQELGIGAVSSIYKKRFLEALSGYRLSGVPLQHIMTHITPIKTYVVETELRAALEAALAKIRVLEQMQSLQPTHVITPEVCFCFPQSCALPMFIFTLVCGPRMYGGPRR